MRLVAANCYNLASAFPIPSMSPSKRLSVSLPADLAAKVEALAKEDRRSVAQWIAVQVELAVLKAEAMKEQGMTSRDRLDEEAAAFQRLS